MWEKVKRKGEWKRAIFHYRGFTDVCDVSDVFDCMKTPGDTMRESPAANFSGVSA
jgi:hypothetical protein